MKVLVLGCGEMGKVAVRDLIEHHVFGDVTVATRHPERSEDFLASFPHRGVRARAVRLDVHDRPALIALMKQHTVTCNLAGPNYRNAVAVARAAIASGCNMVDVSDDFESTLEMLTLHADARRAGITIIVGLGASPGVTNILARYGADKLDRVEEVRTSWIMRASDMGGPALAMHLLHSLPYKAFVFENGQMREVQPFVDGRETFHYPQLGPVEVMHIGHPEPLTLSRFIKGIRYADDKATFLPTMVNDLIVSLGRSARAGASEHADRPGRDPVAIAADDLLQACHRMTDEPNTGALRTEVRGELAGRSVRLVYSAAGRIGIGTGVPASIGAMLLAIGKVSKKGVWPPEACLEPEWFLQAIDTRKIGQIEEQLLDWDRDEVLAR
jgi:saccharopine dehydrogenase (NAD+, L-lysine-forming)